MNTVIKLILNAHKCGLLSLESTMRLIYGDELVDSQLKEITNNLKYSYEQH